MKAYALLFAPCLLAACATASLSVKTDGVAGVDFSRLHSFALHNGQILSSQGYAVENSPANHLIADTITQSLSDKGLKPAADKADLTVNYLMGASQTGQMEKLPASVSYNKDSGWETQGPRTWYKENTQGGMIIEIRDSSDHLVWRAFINGEINSNSGSRTIRVAIQKALAQYPGSYPP